MIGFVYDVQDVARFVINYSYNIDSPISNLKLQKILYFIQADFLSGLGRPCFNEDIVAWDFGPVVPKVYHEYKKFGSSFIPLVEKYVDDKNGIWNSRIVRYTDECIKAEEDRKRIKEMVEECSKYSAAQLVEITHNQTPWEDARYSFNPNKIITQSAIQNYFAGDHENE